MNYLRNLLEIASGKKQSFEENWWVKMEEKLKWKALFEENRKDKGLF